MHEHHAFASPCTQTLQAQAELQAAKESHAGELRSMQDAHSAELASLHGMHADEASRLLQEGQLQLAEEVARHAEQLEVLHSKHQQVSNPGCKATLAS